MAFHNAFFLEKVIVFVDFTFALQFQLNKNISYELNFADLSKYNVQYWGSKQSLHKPLLG